MHSFRKHQEPGERCGRGMFRRRVPGRIVRVRDFDSPLGTSQTTTVSWDTTFVASGAFLIRVKADIQDQVPESNEGNNERTEQIIVMPGPVLLASPNALSFGYSPTQQAFSIWNSGGGVLNYSVDANRPWLGVSPGSGTCAVGATNLTTVTIDGSGLLIGTTAAFWLDHSAGSERLGAILLRKASKVTPARHRQVSSISFSLAIQTHDYHHANSTTAVQGHSSF